MDIVTKESLINFATSFIIDELLDITLEKRSPTTWVIFSSGQCLNKEGEWDYERTPSNRTDEYIASTRFNSIEEAVDFYLRWRSQFYLFVLKGKHDRRWVCWCQSKNLEECEASWEYSLNKRQVFGRWLILGPDRSIIKEAKGESGNEIKFTDFPSGKII